MRITFFGTADFAIPTLKLLHQKGFEIKPVVTTPLRRRGRGLRLTPSPVENAAREIGLEVLTPENPNRDQFLETLKHYAPECGVLVAYGFILKPPLFTLPPLGFINLHPSLLPRYRGAAPIPRQLLDGCTESGVTVIAVESGIDSGDILNQRPVTVDPDETAGELSARLAQLGAELVYQTLNQILEGTVKRHPQNPQQATYAPKLTAADRIIDWQQPALQIHNRIRALSPEPGALTRFRGLPLIILRSRLRAEPGNRPLPPGSIVAGPPGLIVATGNGLLEILELKPAGKKLLTGGDFRNGYRPLPGEKLGGDDEKDL